MCRQPSFLHVLSAEVAVATTTSLAMSAVHRCFVRSSGKMYLQYQHSVLPLLKPHKTNYNSALYTCHQTFTNKVLQQTTFSY
uniref:Putative secreted protein n=1 Tax=Rhipicephalus microplus TaxID=6941 RepID=A0A6G5A342_RHIMP